MDTAQFSMPGWPPMLVRPRRHWHQLAPAAPFDTGLAADPAWRVHPRPDRSLQRLAVASLVAAVTAAAVIAGIAPLAQPESPAAPLDAVEMMLEPPPPAPALPAMPTEALATSEPTAPPDGVAAEPRSTLPFTPPPSIAPSASQPERPAPIAPLIVKPAPARRQQPPAAREARQPPLAAGPEATERSAEPDRAAAPTAGEIAAFKTAMSRAVKAALVYPPAARMAGQAGELHIGFDYLDGAVSNVAATASSGLPMLDRAAVTTVQSARLPLPPAAMAHRTLHLTITVQFDAEAAP